MFATPYRYECRCKCHEPGSTIMHCAPCCKPDPSQEEITLRSLLASYAGSLLIYRDDGEMQDGDIDFLRDHPTTIAQKLTTRALLKLKAAQERIEIKEYVHLRMCHPETCNCPSHILYLDGVCLSQGDFKELQSIAHHLSRALAKGKE